jgi:midasin (ATPase involved in ribosome maturation)
MRNRAISARILAKLKPAKKKKEKVVEEVKQLLAKDPETGEVVHTFKSLEEAEENEFKSSFIKGAITKGTKYKGHLWEYSE